MTQDVRHNKGTAEHKVAHGLVIGKGRFTTTLVQQPIQFQK
jgi:hypothetical protein